MAKNHRRKRQKKNDIPKKLLSTGVALSMVCSSVMPAFAMLNATKHNTPEQNRKLLKQVTELAQDETKTPEQKLYELQDLGVIGEDEVKKVLSGATQEEKEQFAKILAEIVSSDVIRLNGEECTLDTIREMLADPNVDLTQKVDVDGIEVTMGDLKTMVEIEDRIQEIAGSFLFPEDMTEQQRAEYDSIMNQLQTDGIELEVEETDAARIADAGSANSGQASAQVSALPQNGTAKRSGQVSPFRKTRILTRRLYLLSDTLSTGSRPLPKRRFPYPNGPAVTARFCGLKWKAPNRLR